MLRSNDRGRLAGNETASQVHNTNALIVTSPPFVEGWCWCDEFEHDFRCLDCGAPPTMPRVVGIAEWLATHRCRCSVAAPLADGWLA